jgi:uncharacterized protein (TIGR02246 family)
MRLAIAALLLLTSCATVSTIDPANEVRAQSAALARAAGNVEQSLAFFTSTAVMHVEGAPALRGHAEIAEHYRVLFPTLVTFWNDVHEVRVAGSGELAYEIGVHHLTVQQTELQKLGIKESTSRYLAIWTRGKDRVWRIDALSITRNP